MHKMKVLNLIEKNNLYYLIGQLMEFGVKDKNQFFSASV